MKRVSLGLLFILVLTIMVAACGDNTSTTGSAVTTLGGTVTGAATTSTTPIGTTTAGTTTTGTATTGSSSGTPTVNATTTSGSGTATSGTSTTTSGTTTTAAGTNTSASGTTTPSTTSGTTTTTAAGATTSASGLSQTNTGLPAYSGARVLNVGSAFESTLAMPLAQQIVGMSATNVRYQLFATSDTYDKVFSFYDGEMTKLGLSKYMASNTTPTTTPMASGPLATISNIAKFAIYSKGNTDSSPRAGLAVIGPLDSTTVSALTLLDSSLSSNLKVGDNLVMLVNALPTSGS